MSDQITNDNRADATRTASSSVTAEPIPDDNTETWADVQSHQQSTAQQYAQQARDGLVAGANRVQSTAQQYPWATLGAAVATGFLVAYFLKRRR